MKENDKLLTLLGGLVNATMNDPRHSFDREFLHFGCYTVFGGLTITEHAEIIA